jgi:hypothetical protein
MQLVSKVLAGPTKFPDRAAHCVKVFCSVTRIIPRGSDYTTAKVSGIVEISSFLAVH